VRERPSQWLMFEDVWTEDASGPAAAPAGDQEIVPQASGLRRR